MFGSKSFGRALLATTILSFGAPITASAQEVEDEGLAEIIVTATRRETALQDTPISVSAISGEAILDRGIGDLAELTLTQPSIVMGADAQFGHNVAIRGIDSAASGIGADTPVAFYVDGVYLGRNASGVFGLANVERVEILRGPQGTLFGRNATAGAVHVITKLPGDEVEYMLEGEYGNFDHTRIRGYVSGPLTDTVSMSLAAYHRQASSFSNRNSFTGEEMNPISESNLRFTLRYRPGSDTDVIFRADVGNAEPDAWRPDVVTKPGYTGTAADASIDNIATTIPWIDDISVNDDEYIRRQRGGASLTVEHDLTDWVQLTSISAWRTSDDTFLVDSDGTTVAGQRSWQNYERQDQYSQEFRLTSTSEGPFQWLTGLYYFREDATTRFYADRFNLSPPDEIGFLPHNVTESISVYGEVSYDFLEDFTVHAGLRYTDETKEFSTIFLRDLSPDATRDTPRPLPFDESTRQFTETNWTDLSPKIGFDYRPTEDLMLYLSAQRGFKSGGNNFTSTSLLTNPTFDPETVVSYEAGVKSDWLDHRLRLNLAAFRMDYEDLQVRAPGGTAGLIIFRNAADAEVTGVEVEALYAPSPAWLFFANMSVLDGTYQNYVFPVASAAGCVGGAFDAGALSCDLSGNRLQRAPEFSSSLGVTYTHSLTSNLALETNLTWAHTGENYYDDRNTLGTGAYDLVDASVALRPEQGPWSMRLWVKNLTDERFYTHLNPIGAGILGYPNWPMTYGLTLTFRN